MPEPMSFTYTIATIAVAELLTPAPGAVIKNCQGCDTPVWYDPMGDPEYGKGLPKFICIDCAALKYQNTGQLPVLDDHTRKRLRSLGYDDRDIAMAMFEYTVRIIGKKRGEQPNNLPVRNQARRRHSQRPGLEGV
jgi:hypothetical protein